MAALAGLARRAYSVYEMRTLPWTGMPVLVAPIAGALSDRIGGRVPLAEGDTLQIGPYEFALDVEKTATQLEAPQILRARVDAQPSNLALFAHNPAQKLQLMLQIANDLGISRSTIARWKRLDEFRARVDEHLAEIRAEVRRIGIAEIPANWR